MGALGQVGIILVIAVVVVVVIVSERRTSATGAFVMAGVAIGAETSSSWAIAMIVVMKNTVVVVLYGKCHN